MYIVTLLLFVYFKFVFNTIVSAFMVYPNYSIRPRWVALQRALIVWYLRSVSSSFDLCAMCMGFMIYCNMYSLCDLLHRLFVV